MTAALGDGERKRHGEAALPDPESAARIWREGCPEPAAARAGAAGRRGGGVRLCRAGEGEAVAWPYGGKGGMAWPCGDGGAAVRKRRRRR
uniref:DUF834 domain-containing protein n=1 Tax=Oryza rufipogon TaxID=4529 RepID=A0A0E0P8N0_ORYRU